MSDCLWPHGLQHIRLPYPLLYLRICSSSCKLRQWCYLTISSSVTPFSSCHLSSPESGSFSSESALHNRWPKDWSFSFTISLSNEYQGWFSLGLIDLICLQSKGLSRVFSSIAIQKHQFFGAQSSLWSSYHIHTWPLGKA